MPLNDYDWSPKYGWVQDKYGINWQLALGKPEDVESKFSPFFTFTGENFGRAEEAVHFYTSVFPDASVRGILKHRHVPEAEKETVLHAQFSLCNQVFMAIDSGAPHAFQFNEGVSFVISCMDQKEIDYFWQMLTDGGQESMCGWLKDKFGVWWQVVPYNMGKIFQEKGEKVMKAFCAMQKIDMDLLMEL
jgi:predicted 3-demethylubiquinone-9 3-methyltransferase (glyoxalase superfamily)